jgi:plastocyanin
MTRILRLLGAAGLAAFLVAACGGGDDDGSTAAPATTTAAAAPTSAAATTAASPTEDNGGGADDTATITIENFRYGQPIKVKPGATVTVVNKDVAKHDVVADQNQMFKTELLAKDQTATFTAPTTPGTYTFSCSVHQNMTGIGTLVVEG